MWKVAAADQERLSTALPVEVVPERPQPWMLHMLQVNTMNFCAFACCPEKAGETFDQSQEILIAVPNTLESEAVDIFQLPSQARLHTVRPGKANGMAMCLGLLHSQSRLLLVSAFENGFACVHRLGSDGSWTMTYRSQAHTQPILSLAVDPSHEYFLTSSADAAIAKHPLPLEKKATEPAFDPNNRIIEEVDDHPSQPTSSSLSAQLKASRTRSTPSQPKLVEKEHTETINSINTKHSGQQSLHIRSDGRIFATAGWDSQVRVYSCKTLKELAVLSWHKVGCYAVAFAVVDVPTNTTPSAAAVGVAEDGKGKHSSAVLAARKQGGLSVKERRMHQARGAHWIAAGAKDGRVSLWDIY